MSDNKTVLPPRGICRFLIVVECLVCFGPAILTLMVGVAFLPQIMLGVAAGQNSPVLLLTVIGGLIGTVGAVLVINRVLYPTTPPRNPLFALIFSVVGIATILWNAWPKGVNIVGLKAWEFLPLFGALHMLYLYRHSVRMWYERSQASSL